MPDVRSQEDGEGVAGEELAAAPSADQEQEPASGDPSTGGDDDYVPA